MGKAYLEEGERREDRRSPEQNSARAFGGAGGRSWGENREPEGVHGGRPEGELGAGTTRRGS